MNSSRTLRIWMPVAAFITICVYFLGCHIGKTIAHYHLDEEVVDGPRNVEDCLVITNARGIINFAVGGMWGALIEVEADNMGSDQLVLMAPGITGNGAFLYEFSYGEMYLGHDSQTVEPLESLMFPRSGRPLPGGVVWITGQTHVKSDASVLLQFGMSIDLLVTEVEDLDPLLRNEVLELTLTTESDEGVACTVTRTLSIESSEHSW